MHISPLYQKKKKKKFLEVINAFIQWHHLNLGIYKLFFSPILGGMVKVNY